MYLRSQIFFAIAMKAAGSSERDAPRRNIAHVLSWAKTWDQQQRRGKPPASGEHRLVFVRADGFSHWRQPFGREVASNFKSADQYAVAANEAADERFTLRSALSPWDA